MKARVLMMLVVCVLLAVANVASATIDTFGTGANQFTIDFVNISGDTNPASGYGIVAGDYRIGTYEITNDQWNKFSASYGTVTGSPSNAYDENATWTGTNVPTNELSWYEGAQFVNWLNTSTGHQAAYKFTGTQGTSGYTLGVWEAGDGYDSSNPFRNSNAFYFLPTEDEWVKAAYWNGSALQTWATSDDTQPTAGDESNYDLAVGEPWNVGSGSEELNGTFDMMGNVWEWVESPYDSGDYTSSERGVRGGSYYNIFGVGEDLRSSHRGSGYPDEEFYGLGFRVASVPEPATLLLLGLGAVMLRKMLKITRLFDKAQ